MSDWIQTFTGRQFWPLKPNPAHIDIRDIAHALSMKCRYGGHTKHFYSVAEHSILVADNSSVKNFLTALLHDASEAYLADVPSPIKPFLPGYAEIEERLDRVIAARFGLTYPWPDEVQDLDKRILMDERAALLEPPPAAWSSDSKPLGVRIYGRSPTYAENTFLHSFRMAGGA